MGAYILGSVCSVQQDQETIKQIYQKAVTASDQFKQAEKTQPDNGVYPIVPANSTNRFDTKRNAEEEAEPASQEQKSWWHSFACEIKITDFFIACFTLALALFTYFLWDATHRLWKAGERQITAAMIAARAAESQASVANRQFLLENRPVIRVQAVTLLGRDGSTSGPHLSKEFPVRGDLYCGNAGLTDATIIESSAEVFIHEGWLPARPPYESGARTPFIHGRGPLVSLRNCRFRGRSNCLPR